MTLDWLILAVCVILAPTSGMAFIVMLWWASSIWLVEWYELGGSWSDLILWAKLFLWKDIILMLAAGFGRSATSYIITVFLFVSVIYHWVMLEQINSHVWNNVTTIQYGYWAMLLLVVAMLSTVIVSFIGGGSNGGKRVRSRFDAVYRRMGFVLHLATYKAEK